jgi:flagellar hook protein FlgE
MMRSLWAGVTGLQAHQIAMDVEGNNIANVNTVGFKYSRANFSDLLSQTSKIATAPQGELGGKNPMQVGLGTQVSSITKIFKQGSVQTTDKNTDLAIQGDGFFVVSPDGGSTYKYTRNGDFVFDAKGNFTDSNGYIVQGWMRDDETGEIDSTGPIRNITIPPGLTTPANDTNYITLKANLNSGDNIVNKKPIYALDSYKNWYDKNLDKVRSSTEVNRENDSSITMFDTDKKLTDTGIDMGVLHNSNGEAFNLRDGQGLWVSYASAKTTAVSVDATDANLNITLNGEVISGSVTGTSAEIVANNVAALINAKSHLTGVTAEVQNINEIVLVNNNNLGTESKMKNIKLQTNGGDVFTTDTNVITAYQYTYSPNSVTESNDYNDGVAREFNTTADLRRAMQKDARDYVNYNGRDVNAGNAWVTDPATNTNYNPGATVTINNEGKFQIQNFQNDTAFDGRFISGQVTQANLTTYLDNSAVTIPSGTTVVADGNGGWDIDIPAGANNVEITYTSGGTETTVTAVAGGATVTIPEGATLVNDVTFPEDTTFGASNTSDVDLTTKGIVYNNNPGTGITNKDMYLSVTSLTNSGSNDVSANEKFTTSFSAIQGALVTGESLRTTQNIYAANHASSIDVYDSLGSKHTVRLEFTKVGTSDSGGTRWSMMISVPEPGEINYTGTGLDNVVMGEITFNSDGSLATFTPSSITYTANNGSTPNQNIELRLGNLGKFDGMTSFDAQSNTSGISQDGYPGGDLSGIRIDETGTLIGSFTNGRSFGLAQVSMAKFTNNNGLESDGGNSFIQTSNSGDPIIGQAAIGGRGFIQASSLEMSNVDLSRSLTQLIVVQRGYQANSKTITTSDQMLNTLLQLKQ